MTDDLLDLEVTDAHQQLASRLALASIDGDTDRFRQALAEIHSGGLDCAIAVLVLTNNHLACGVVSAIGVQKARTLFESTILDGQ